VTVQQGASGLSGFGVEQLCLGLAFEFLCDAPCSVPNSTRQSHSANPVEFPGDAAVKPRLIPSSIPTFTPTSHSFFSRPL